jgi:hypothetical protein
MKSLIKDNAAFDRNAGMEMVQVAILIAIAIAAGLIFRTKIVGFVNNVFGNLNAGSFM